MSNTSDAKCRQCRKAGKKLFLKGAKCSSPKCVLLARNFPPGLHGSKRPGKKSQYGQQLAEKQRAKTMYGMREKQFRLLFERAGRLGDAGEHLLKMLETRFDNTIFRLGLASSRPQARQMVSHGMFTINGKLVNIPSYQVKAGAIIGIKKNKRNKKIFLSLNEKIKKMEMPSWLFFKVEDMEAKVLHAPTNDDLDKSINIQAIVEFYSK